MRLCFWFAPRCAVAPITFALGDGASAVSGAPPPTRIEPVALPPLPVGVPTVSHAAIPAQVPTNAPMSGTLPIGASSDDVRAGVQRLRASASARLEERTLRRASTSRVAASSMSRRFLFLAVAISLFCSFSSSALAAKFSSPKLEQLSRETQEAQTTSQETSEIIKRLKLRKGETRIEEGNITVLAEKQSSLSKETEKTRSVIASIANGSKPSTEVSLIEGKVEGREGGEQKEEGEIVAKPEPGYKERAEEYKNSAREEWGTIAPNEPMSTAPVVPVRSKAVSGTSEECGIDFKVDASAPSYVKGLCGAYNVIHSDLEAIEDASFVLLGLWAALLYTVAASSATMVRKARSQLVRVIHILLPTLGALTIPPLIESTGLYHSPFIQFLLAVGIVPMLLILVCVHLIHDYGESF